MDEASKPLSSKVYSVRRVLIPSNSELVIEGRLSRQMDPAEMILEGLLDGRCLIGSAMVKPDSAQKLPGH